MSNDLQMKCPECGHTESFQVSCTTLAVVTEGGIDPSGYEMEYDSASHCWCPACDHSGLVGEFNDGGAA